MKKSFIFTAEMTKEEFKKECNKIGIKFPAEFTIIPRIKVNGKWTTLDKLMNP